MNSLIIDCSDGMSIYVVSGSKVFSSVENDQKKHTDNLLLVVDELLEKAKLKISDIQNVGVCIGPGSFTGIRVAVSVCKGICIGTGAKAFVCSNFDIFSFGEKRPAIYVLEAFSNYVYTRKFDGTNSVDSCILLDEFKEMLLGNEEIYVSNEKTQNILKNVEIQSKIAQNRILDVFLDKFNKGENVEIKDIEPIYLRASQAEIERDKKLREGKNGGF